MMKNQGTVFNPKMTLVLFFAFFSKVCIAQVTLAYCTLNGGCKFYQTPLSYKQVDLMMNYLGVFEEKKGIVVFFKNKSGENIYYADNKRSVRELDTYFGGKGEPVVAKDAVRSPFGDATIQPNDGDWKVSAKPPVVKNCPAGLDEQASKLNLVKSGKKVFKRPFQMQELLPPGSVGLNTEPNAYRGLILVENQPTFKTIYEVKVKNPNFMEAELNYSIAIPSQPTCIVKIDFTYTRQ
ncbi:hypothetical protein [Runella aurantiaca]|nr:hypothetical protein [Runella aurantiaca]